jgi:hypothetical protein
MSEFMQLEAQAPATLGRVVEAVAHLSTLSEAQILELVSAGKIRELFPFKPARGGELPADYVDEDDLVEASASPLSREQRRTLIESSLPPTERARRTRSPNRGAEAKKRTGKR